MGGLGLRAARAYLLLALGAALIVAAVYLLGGWVWAMLTVGILVVAYALLLVDVPEPKQLDPARAVR